MWNCKKRVEGEDSDNIAAETKWGRQRGWKTIENINREQRKMQGEIISGEMSCQSPPQQMRKKTAASLPDKTRQTRQQVGENSHHREAEYLTENEESCKNSEQCWWKQTFRTRMHANIQGGAGCKHSVAFFFLQSTVMSLCSEDQSCRNLISQYYSCALVSLSVLRPQMTTYLQHHRIGGWRHTNAAALIQHAANMLEQEKDRDADVLQHNARITNNLQIAPALHSILLCMCRAFVEVKELDLICRKSYISHLCTMWMHLQPPNFSKQQQIYTLHFKNPRGKVFVLLGEKKKLIHNMHSLGKCPVWSNLHWKNQ